MTLTLIVGAILLWLFIGFMVQSKNGALYALFFAVQYYPAWIVFPCLFAVIVLWPMFTFAALFIGYTLEWALKR